MTPPRLSRLVAYWIAATFVALFAVGVATQDRYQPPPRSIGGLVLDGGTVTTTAPSPLRPVAEPIPRRDIEQEDQGADED